jgi:hypothetical protein
MSAKRVRRPAPEVTRGALPLVAAFLRGYLHQDWEADYETPEDARDAFLEDASPDERREFLRECEAFHTLTSSLDLADLVTVLQVALGSAWQPEDPAEVRRVLSGGRRRR